MNLSLKHGEHFKGGFVSMAEHRYRRVTGKLGAAIMCIAVSACSAQTVQAEMPEMTAIYNEESVEIGEQQQYDAGASDAFIDHEIQRFMNMRIADRQVEIESPTEVELLQEEPTIAEVTPLIERAALQYDIDPNMMAAFAWKESCGVIDPGISSAGAEGFMQVMPATAEDMIEKHGMKSYNPQNPEDSIKMAAKVIATNRDHYLPNMIDASYLENETTAQEILPVSYNWGIGGAQRYVESGFDRSILPSQTLDYLIEVEYLLEELPATGEETRCKGNPQTG